MQISVWVLRVSYHFGISSVGGYSRAASGIVLLGFRFWSYISTDGGLIVLAAYGCPVLTTETHHVKYLSRIVKFKASAYLCGLRMAASSSKLCASCHCMLPLNKYGMSLQRAACVATCRKHREILV